jgi:hypothetical protein
MFTRAAAVFLAQVPNPAPAAPPGVAAKADLFISWLKWGGLAAGVAGLIVCALMMILGRNRRSSTAVDGAGGIPWVLGGLTLIALSSGVVGAFL